MDINSIEVFGYIAKYGNLSLAAEEMHMSQSALSRTLSALEKELGAKLFDRSTSPMELTVEGEIVLKRCCAITSEHYQMMAELKEARTGARKIVRISGLLNSSMASCIYKTRKKGEELEMNLVIKSTLIDMQIPFNALRDGLVDVVFEAYSDMIDVHDLADFPIHREQAFLIIENDNQLAKKDVLKIEDLKDTTLLSLSRNTDHSLRKHVQSICRNHGFAGRLTVKPGLSRETLLLSDFDGGGMLLPESMIKDMKYNYLGSHIALPIEDEDAYFDLRAFYSSVQKNQPSEFLTCLRQVVADQEQPFVHS